MEVNSIRKVINLIRSLNVEESELNYTIKKVDYCYELNIDDYTIYFEDIPYEKNKCIEICYKLTEPLYIKLSKKETKYFRIIFSLLLTNYLRNCKLQEILSNKCSE